MKKKYLLLLFTFYNFYSDAQVWSPLANGMNSSVYCIQNDTVSNLLYAGGYLTTAGFVSASYIAKWNGIAWSAMGAGLSNPAYSLAIYNGSLYTGGNFTTAGGTAAGNIAKWNGTAW